MENYIIRIYRFEKDNPRSLVGIVESVEGKRRGKRAFNNLDDLWEILNSELSEGNIQNRLRTGKESKMIPSRFQEVL